MEEQASQLDTSEDKDQRFYIGEVKDRINDDEWITHLDINGTNVALKMDTGAQANVLPWREFIKPQMKPKISHRKQSPLKGMCGLTLKHRKKDPGTVFNNNGG